jgi:Crp-like helix-turn-helix domain
MSSGSCQAGLEPRKLSAGWFRIDNEVIDDYARSLGPIPLAVYVLLCRRADNATSRCYRLAHSEIAAMIGSSISSVQRALKLLEQRRLVRAFRRKAYEPCDYELLQIKKRLQATRATPLKSNTGTAEVIPSTADCRPIPSERPSSQSDRHNKEKDCSQDLETRRGVQREQLAELRRYIQSAFVRNNALEFCPWEDQEEKALLRFLGRFPELSMEKAKVCVDHYFESVTNWAELAAKRGFRNLDHLLEHLVFESPFSALVIIDSMPDELEGVLSQKFRFGVEVLELSRYENIAGDYVYGFEPFLADVTGESSFARSDSVTPTISPENIDTVVVPAREEGFQEVFLGQNCWYAVRIHGAVQSQIKYIAAYQVAPVSAITHLAPVRLIEPWKDSGKVVLYFSEPAKPIGPLPLVKGGKVSVIRRATACSPRRIWMMFLFLANKRPQRYRLRGLVELLWLAMRPDKGVRTEWVRMANMRQREFNGNADRDN